MSLTLHRADGLMDYQTARNTKLVFLGCGSLNSTVELFLARFPFREVVFCDPEALGEENLERHVLGPKYLGVNKAAGMAHWLTNEKGIDPRETKITVHECKAEEILEQHLDASIWILGIDKPSAIDNVDAVARKHKIPMISGGVYERGKGGDVIFLPNPSEFCYNCAMVTLGGGQLKEKNATDVNYGIDPTNTTEDSREIKAVPALYPNIGSIAADLAILIISFLNGNDTKPLISVRSISEWIKIFNLRNDDEDLANLIAFITSQISLGIKPMLRITREKSTCNVLMDSGTIRLVQSKKPIECPYHDIRQISLDDL